MVGFRTNNIKGYKEMDIPYTVIGQDMESPNLAILLPGAGYTTQRPLFHYSEAILLNKQLDILEINYPYMNKFYDDFGMEELTDAIQYDVRTVIDEVLKHTSYENYFLVGKSIGTIAMSAELDRDIFKDAKTIWLTPLIQRDDVLDAMLKVNHKSLAFIGDKDPCYTEERFGKLKSNPNINLHLIADVNHSLEYENNVIESIHIIKNVMQAIEQF